MTSGNLDVLTLLCRHLFPKIWPFSKAICFPEKWMFFIFQLLTRSSNTVPLPTILLLCARHVNAAPPPLSLGRRRESDRLVLSAHARRPISRSSQGLQDVQLRPRKRKREWTLGWRARFRLRRSRILPHTAQRERVREKLCWAFLSGGKNTDRRGRWGETTVTVHLVFPNHSVWHSLGFCYNVESFILGLGSAEDTSQQAFLA